LIRKDFDEVLRCIKEGKDCYVRSPEAVRVVVESPSKASTVASMLGFPAVELGERFSPPRSVAYLSTSDLGAFSVLPSGGHVFVPDPYFDVLKGEGHVEVGKCCSGIKVESVLIKDEPEVYFAPADELACLGFDLSQTDCITMLLLGKVHEGPLANFALRASPSTPCVHAYCLARLAEAFGADKTIAASDPDAEGERIAEEVAVVIGGEHVRARFHEITPKEVTSAIEKALRDSEPFDNRLALGAFARAVADNLEGLALSTVLQYLLAVIAYERPTIKPPKAKLLAEFKEFVASLESDKRKAAVLALASALPRGVDPVKAYEELKAKVSEPKDFMLGALAAHLRNNSVGRVQSAVLWHSVLIDFAAKECTAYKVSFEDGSYVFAGERIKEKEVEVRALNKRKAVLKHPTPPTTADVLQLGNPSEVMTALQSLYQKGLITYPRTDSIHLSYRGYSVIKEIAEKLGLEVEGPRYVSERLKGHHEAIRPTTPALPSDLNLGPVEKKVYAYIVARSLASQMSDAEAVVASEFELGGVKAFGPRKFDFTALRPEPLEAVIKVLKAGWVEAFDALEVPRPFTVISEGKKAVKKVEKAVACSNLRITASSLVEMMKREGIGRPSTYAEIIDSLVRRGYLAYEVVRKGSKRVPTQEMRLMVAGKVAAVLAYAVFKAFDSNEDFDEALMSAFDELAEKKYDLRTLLEMRNEMVERARRAVELVEDGSGEEIKDFLARELERFKEIVERSAIMDLAARFRLRIASLYPLYSIGRKGKVSGAVSQLVEGALKAIDALVSSREFVRSFASAAAVAKASHLKDAYLEAAKEAIAVLLDGLA